MIIIFTESTDITSTSVLDWLFYYKKEFMVIYPDSYIEITDISLPKSIHRTNHSE